MTDSPAKTTLTPDQAKKKWGAKLLHPTTRTYAHFLEDGGEWRPELQDGELTGYRWTKRQTVKPKPWRRH